ncbi:MAG: helix-turn-helix domain-containing protein [Bacteroidota bacterium]
MKTNDTWFLKPILNLDEASRYCGLSKSRMYQHTAKKKIPHYKPEGKLIYFKREDLDNWLLSNKVLTKEQVKGMATKIMMA